MPTQIEILGVPYKVEYVDVVNKEELRRGEIDFLNAVIRIDRTQTEEHQMQTLIHEAIHGICDALGLTDIGENENAVQSLATGLYCTFRSVFTSSWSATERFPQST